MAPDEAADILRGLSAPVTTVKGVGEAMAANLAKLGINSIDDMLFYLPRRHDDYTRLTPINRLPVNEVVTVIGTITRAEIRAGRTQRKDFYIELDDGSGLLSITFFGMHFLVRDLRPGKQIVVSGRTSIFRERLQMTNPEWEALDSDNLHTVGIVPVYSLTQGLTARTLRRLMQKTITYWTERLPDYVPEPVLDRCELGDLGWAIKNLHFRKPRSPAPRAAPLRL
ncbi:hypothetical protein HC928_26130 [bacterium]|nr:hypothetical protein [bacterium]